METIDAKRKVELTEREWIQIHRACNAAALQNSKHANDRTLTAEMRKFYEDEEQCFFSIAKKVLEREQKPCALKCRDCKYLIPVKTNRTGTRGHGKCTNKYIHGRLYTEFSRPACRRFEGKENVDTM